MIVIVSRDTLFATMLQYELQDNTAQQVQLFADTNEQREALQAALRKHRLSSQIWISPQIFNRNSLAFSRCVRHLRRF